MGSNWTLLYDALLTYRNACFAHVATTLQAQFGPDWFEAEVRQLFSAREWTELERVEESYALAGLSIPVPTHFQRLGVPHLAPIIQKHGRVVIARMEDGAKPGPRRIEAVVKLAKDVRNVRDPAAHPPSDELPTRDLYYYTEVARRVLDALGLETASTQLAEMLSAQGVSSPPAVYLQVPPPSTVVQHFVGREKELEELQGWVGDEHEPVRVIAGGGGTGKSALAYQFAVSLEDRPSRLNFVLWMSAKRRRLIGGKVEAIESEIFDDNDVRRVLWSFFGGGDTEVDQVTLESFLSDTPGLIIADDVDSLDGPGGERAKALFSREIPYRTNTKVLMTSRTQLFGLENVTGTLPGFNEAELAAFLASRMEDLSTKLELSAAQLTQLRQVTDGIPLYLEDLIRFILTHAFDTALRQWGEHGGGDNAREYALMREFEVLSLSAQRSLLAAARFGEPTSALELAEILRCDDATVADSIQELQRLFLMSRPSFIEGVPRFSVPTNTVHLVNKMFADQNEYNRIANAVEYYRQEATTSRSQRGIIGEIIRTVHLLVRRNELTQAEAAIEVALAAHPSHPDLIGFKGYIYKCFVPVRFIDADEAFNTASALHCKNAEMYKHWADLHLTVKDYEKAATAAERGISECGATPELCRLAGVAHRDLGNRLVRDMQNERAFEEYRRARSHLRRMLDVNATSDTRAQIPAFERYSIYLKVLTLIEKVRPGYDQTDEIDAVASEWLQLHPSSPEALSWVALVQHRQGTP